MMPEIQNTIINFVRFSTVRFYFCAIHWAPLKTPFNCQPLIYDKLFKNNLCDTSLSLSHLAPARLLRDASSRLVLFKFA